MLQGYKVEGGTDEMKKQKVKSHVNRYIGKELRAKREISFEIKLSSRLYLDELCYNYNKNIMESKLNEAIDSNNEEAFYLISETYRNYI